MRFLPCLFASCFGLVLIASCTPQPTSAARVIGACWRGDQNACRGHRLAEQAQLDAGAIMLGIRLAALEDQDQQAGEQPGPVQSPPGEHRR